MIDQIPPELVALGGTALAAGAAYFGGKRREAMKKVANFETELRKYIEKELGFDSPEVQEVGRDFIKTMLEEEIPNYSKDEDGPVTTYFSDGTYYIPKNKVDMKNAKMYNFYSLFPYRPDRFDCDNYSESWKNLVPLIWGTNGVGDVRDHSAGHAYNIIVYSDGTIEFFEPQESKVVKLGEDDRYQLEEGVVRF